MAQTTIETTTIFRTIEAILIAVGPAVTAYYLTSFTVDAHGYYYRDAEFGIAAGVFLTAAAFALRYWRREA
jgi:hypothetical protein